MTSLAQVKQFHHAFGCDVNAEPHLGNRALIELRLKLLREELTELEEATADRDVCKAFDALLDLQYVLDGAFLALGFWRAKDAGMAEVHRSNMSKLGPDGLPVLREDGKVLKGPGYTPPDLERVLDDHIAANDKVSHSAGRTPKSEGMK